MLSSMRGPLKYNIETSSPQIEAGKKFSISMQITNPYDVPVAVHDVNTQLPVELVDPTTSPNKQGFVSLFKAELARRTPANPETVTGSGPTPPDEPVQLQPGNSTVKTFTIRTKWAIFFPPASYNLYLWVDYEIDGCRNKDSVRYTLNIRSPLKAIMYGAIVGSALGFILKSIYNNPGALSSANSDVIVKWVIQLFGALLAAAVAVIAFARKKDTQPILSIEDFWGGFFVGFLAGFSGEAFINQFVQHLKLSNSLLFHSATHLLAKSACYLVHPFLKG